MERDLTERISARIISSNLLTKISGPLDKFLNLCFRAPALRWLKIFLNGTWVGHPLHPVLTDIPIGSGCCSRFLNLAWLPA